MLKNLTPFFILIFLFCFSQQTYAQNIVTIAGGGSGLGDGGLGTDAALDSPLVLLNDSENNTYFVEFSTSRIRKISFPDGIITTIAGNGVDDYTGDGGLATQASLNRPQGLSIDSENNLYIADTGNNVIRKVSTSGIISTIAGNGMNNISGDGGLAISAGLSQPSAVSIDGSGNIYVVHPEQQIVRKIDATSGNIETFAGSQNISGYAGDNGPASEALFSNPYGIFATSDNDVYVIERGNCVVRKIDAATNIISTVVGIGQCGIIEEDNVPALETRLNGAGGLFVNEQGDIYIADRTNYYVRKVSASTGIISNITGTGSAGFSGDNGPAIDAAINWPQGVVEDKFGNVLIADNRNDRIRKIGDATSNISIESFDNIIIYPNPTNSILNIKGLEHHTDHYKITVFNTLGAEVHSSENKNVINLSYLPQGSYYLSIQTKTQNIIKKISLIK